MRRRAFPPSGDVGCRICRRRDHQLRSRSQRRCLIRIRLDPFPHLPASPYFATFEHRRAFNSFECGDVPSLHLAMSAIGYLSVETAIEHRCAFNRFECGDVPSLHLAMSAIGYLSVETAKPDQDVGCSARWKASVSAGGGPLLASDPGSLSLPSSTVAHSIGLNANWRHLSTSRQTIMRVRNRA